MRNGPRLGMDCCIEFLFRNGRVVSGREWLLDLHAWDAFRACRPGFPCAPMPPHRHSDFEGAPAKPLPDADRGHGADYGVSCRRQGMMTAMRSQ